MKNNNRYNIEIYEKKTNYMHVPKGFFTLVKDNKTEEQIIFLSKISKNQNITPQDIVSEILQWDEDNLVKNIKKCCHIESICQFMFPSFFYATFRMDNMFKHYVINTIVRSKIKMYKQLLYLPENVISDIRENVKNTKLLDLQCSNPELFFTIKKLKTYILNSPFSDIIEKHLDLKQILYIIELLLSIENQLIERSKQVGAFRIQEIKIDRFKFIIDLRKISIKYKKINFHNIFCEHDPDQIHVMAFYRVLFLCLYLKDKHIINDLENALFTILSRI